MASKLPIPQPNPYDLSPEECQKMFEGVSFQSARGKIPDWHIELLEERIARYCKTGMKGTPWEEFEKELLEQLMKG
jgi:hypothetical protein